MNIKKLIHNESGDVTFTTVFIIVALVMLISFLLLFSSVKINCINIKNGVKMELNNLTASIYKDIYRSQRESNLSAYVNTLYASSSYKQQLEQNFIAGLEDKIELGNEDYRLTNIRLEFRQDGSEKIEYIFTCDAEFYITMFGNQYPAIIQQIILTGHHNTKF